ncbi:MAG: hypothetical protein KY395_06970 [Actinobacteria bacterium]|nr:hypothetical protein [Actinomycetota bacterium]
MRLEDLDFPICADLLSVRAELELEADLEVEREGERRRGERWAMGR